MYFHKIPEDMFEGRYLISTDVAVKVYPTKRFSEISKGDILKCVHPSIRQAWHLEFSEEWFPQYRCYGQVVHLGRPRPRVKLDT